jgi:hypothetical protein
MGSLMQQYAAEVERDITAISAMNVESDEYGEAVTAVNGLMDRYIKLQDQENEYRRIDLEEEKLEIDKKKLESEKRNQELKIWTTVGLAVVYTGIQIWMVKDNQKYETGGGMHTTDAGRSGIRNLFGLFNKLP